MSDLTHIYKVGQKVRVRMGDEIDGFYMYGGTVKEISKDHIIVSVPEISDHCWFENGLNINDVYQEHKFESQRKGRCRI